MEMISLVTGGTILGWAIIPLIAISLTYFQYNSADPESHPTNAREVKTNIIS